jgi:transaldolase
MATSTNSNHEAGQSLWLDNITRDLLTSGTLKRYIDELSITGLTSNPTIFDHAIAKSQAYDEAIREKMQVGKSGEELFKEGLPAIEEAIFAGVPVNVTLLFSREHYVLAADAYMRGIERRLAAGLDPNVRSVASVFISRWDKAVIDKTTHELRDQLGIAVAKRTYRAYRGLLDSNRFQRLANAGARAQRLLWASTGTKDPKASDILYVTSLAAPNTVNTMPEATLQAFATHGEIGPLLTADDHAEEMLARFERAGLDVAALASDLQREGATAFVDSWKELMAGLASKDETLRKAS